MDGAIKETLTVEKDYLRNTLSNHPDWSDKVDKASVALNAGGINYSVDHEDAQDLEYGNPMRNTVATGVLRSTAKRRSYDVSKEFMNRVAKGLL
jgi:hypothetical protein